MPSTVVDAGDAAEVAIADKNPTLHRGLVEHTYSCLYRYNFWKGIPLGRGVAGNFCCIIFLYYVYEHITLIVSLLKICDPEKMSQHLTLINSFIPKGSFFIN